MVDHFALQPTPRASGRTRLATLVRALDERETALAAARAELHALQSRYLAAVGRMYAQIVALEASIVEVEIRAGLRRPIEEEEEEDEDESPADDGAPDDDGDGRPADGCSNRSAPSSDLKKIFRNVARTIHPDLALDEPARWRRHSLMAEANRAYAERDEDRLRLILHAWERSPESVVGDDTDADDERVRRRIVEIEERLAAVDIEGAELRASAIGRLKRKIDEARSQGWDLFAEMVAEVTRELARATARLASLRRLTGQR